MATVYGLWETPCWKSNPLVSINRIAYSRSRAESTRGRVGADQQNINSGSGHDIYR